MMTVEVRAFKCSVCGELFYGKNAESDAIKCEVECLKKKKAAAKKSADLKQLTDDAKIIRDSVTSIEELIEKINEYFLKHFDTNVMLQLSGYTKTPRMSSISISHNAPKWHYMQAVVLPEKESKNDIS